MGYRSEVIIAVTKDAFNLFADQKVKDTLKMYDVTVTEWCSKYYIKFDSVKWYEDYEEIQTLNNFIDKCLEESEDSAAFIRIGEEEGDIDRKGHCSEFDIYPITTVSYPNGKIVANKTILATNSIRFIIED